MASSHFLCFGNFACRLFIPSGYFYLLEEILKHFTALTPELSDPIYDYQYWY
jgi:hypothetical protein